FGLIEMTRQRIRPGLKRSIYRDCPSCDGSGVVKTPESMAIEAVRMLMTAAHHPDAVQIDIQVAEDVATYLNNRKRQEIAQMELEAEISVQILGKEGFAPEQIEIVGRNKHDQEIQFAGI
ncbi:MAG: ribonuclease E, partial [Planctomycetota bacterium]|nr:ribonuclease E [Planctomycetota bacterium]